LQIFEEEITFLYGSHDAILDIASSSDFELDNVLWIVPCLPFGNSLFSDHDDLFFQPMINDYAEVFREDHGKQENFALTVSPDLFMYSLDLFMYTFSFTVQTFLFTVQTINESINYQLVLPHLHHCNSA